MKKHPEVIALLFLGLVWSAGSHLVHTRAGLNRIMVLNGPKHAVVESLETCPLDGIRSLRHQIRDRRSDVRDQVRHEVRSAVIDLKDALRSLKQ